MGKKKNPKQSMICLMSKPSQKNSEIIGISSWRPSNPNLDLVDYTVWGVLENKTNATFNPNYGSLKIAFDDEWNKMY